MKFTVVVIKEFFKMLKVFVPVLAAAFAFACVARAQTVDEVIAKNIQAHGGIEKLKSVNTARTKAKFTQGSFRAEVIEENKRPGKVREEFIIQGMAQVQAYDGKTGWQIYPFGGRKDPELLSQDDLTSLVVASDLTGPVDA